MAVVIERCANCDVDIVDPTTKVEHGQRAYCCVNCAEAMEQAGSGSDPHALRHENDLRCSHCGVAIVNESTMESRGSDAFCCANCARAT
jgi:DNA-directed RNA polymerase subunit RPC12/RpoP